jgi:hypothetical protein
VAADGHGEARKTEQGCEQGGAASIQDLLLAARFDVGDLPGRRSASVGRITSGHCWKKVIQRSGRPSRSVSAAT